jgi:hypothetical protein
MRKSAKSWLGTTISRRSTVRRDASRGGRAARAPEDIAHPSGNPKWLHFWLDSPGRVGQNRGLQKSLVMPPSNRKPAAGPGDFEPMLTGLKAALRIEQ